jgi:glyoxylase-like metal-dependent hydrolase (beta-lactamase superfamily II)
VDWNYFGSEEDRGFGTPPLGKLPPIVDRLELWDGEEVILPGMNTRPAPGHTPGSSLIVLSSGGERAMLLGDVVHCPAQLIETDWEGLHDIDPILARRTREALARELERQEILVAAAHFPGLQFGRLLLGEGRRLFQF